MTLARTLSLGFQLWLRAFIPPIAIVILVSLIFGFLSIDLGELWETLISLIIFFPITLFLVDHSFKIIALRRFSIEIKKFVGWSILWRTSILLAIIGGILSLVPQYHQLNGVIIALLPALFSIPILGWVASYSLTKHTPKDKEGNVHAVHDNHIVQKIEDKQVWRLAITSFVFSLIWLGGIGSIVAIISGRKALRLSKKYDDKVMGIWAAKFGHIAGYIGLCWWGGLLIIILVKNLVY